jgi:hypothetical protein
LLEVTFPTSSLIPGVIGSEGRLWKEQRRFSLITLRDFGMGKIALEDKIMDEARVVVNKLQELNGRSVDIWKTLGTSISNVICSVVFGRTYDHDDPTCDLFLKVFNSNATTDSTRNLIISMLPVLRYLPGDPLHFYNRKEKVQMVDEIIRESIEEHRNNLDRDHIKDFIDAYLVEMENQKEKEDTTFTGKNFIFLIRPLEIFASDTPSVSPILPEPAIPG